ncbi:MAG: PIN domain-containing protein [Deltaproteobacteria bacterium]|nr:PIN domain-containing protein [Deltaproteobacteria bacterium]
MKHDLFIDTGAFYSKYVVRDDLHVQSLELWKQVQKDRYTCVTSNFVLCELITLLVYRFGTLKALRVAREIYSTAAIRIISISSSLELLALNWLEKYLDQDFSMTDATSFALLKDQKISKVFSFDEDFDIAGFERLGYQKKIRPPTPT